VAQLNGTFEWVTRPLLETSYDHIIHLSRQGYRQKEIAEQMNLNKSNVSRHIKRAYQAGKLT
jgi:putative DNA primase/helicase